MSEIPEGKMLVDGELVDSAESCDGSEDGYYACTFPPCVAEREAEAAHWLAKFNSQAVVVTVAIEDFADAYEAGDPKRFDLDRVDA